MKKRTTKKALALSFVSMLMCCAMLIGSTYAWFTDSVTSGTNKIVAGNLDIELKVLDKESGEFVESTDAYFGVDLWEPGVVAYETFQVENVGTLALKYDMYLSVIAMNDLNGHSLDEVIKVGVYDGEVTEEMDRDALVAAVDFKSFTDTAAYVTGETLKANEDAKAFTVVAYWEPTDHDDDYNAKNENRDHEPLYIDFGITVTATQATVEPDSFDNQYDANAEVIVGIPAVTAAINQGAKDSNDALATTTNGLVYFDDALRYEGNVIAINLNFEGAESKDYIINAFDAISDLIVKAVDKEAANIYSIEIGKGLPEKLAALGVEGVKTNVRVLDGKPVVYEGEYESWLYEDLGMLLKKAAPTGTIAERMQACLEYTAEEGLDVEFIDMNGVAQTYRMYFVLGWNTLAPIEQVTEAINQGATDANNALKNEGIECIWFDDALQQEGDALAITLHFGEGSRDYIDVTYLAVKALIGEAMFEQRDNVNFFNIVYTDNVENNRYVKDAASAEEIEDWVEKDLKAVMSGQGSLSNALKAAQEYGLPVLIETMDGESQTYIMHFDIAENW